ncbi:MULTISPECIES: hypothetical protein [Deinococcus]|uniref:Lipoprotein n=1 Tax=Deinococcus rufus TaxID=2136097 RepID=A0ABV7Z5F4_9DEIO|nr:hypothetical protein [Deinococcus sp. AB2017081]WQE96242.1 hypothetical protein U2P90_04925 [Deinococcus sp. AB2017081]
MTAPRRSAAAAFLSVMITLSACGQTPTAVVPTPSPTAGAAPALSLSPTAQASEARTLAVAAARGLTVQGVVTVEDAGVPTTYVDATAGREAVTLIGSVEGSAPVYAELRTVPEGQTGTRGSPFVITPLTAQGTVASGLAAQGVADWVYDRLVSLIKKYKSAPGWLKAVLRGPLKAVIKLIIGEAINRGCTYAYDTLVRKLRADGRWVPLGKALLCDILLG